jgi:hypothetical protein
MSKNPDFDAVVDGQFVPEGAWESLSFDTYFEHLNPYGRLAFLAVNIEMDKRRGPEEAPGMERKLFNRQYPDKNHGLVQQRWIVFNGFYQGVKERLENPAHDPTDVEVFISNRPLAVKYPGIDASLKELFNWSIWKACRQQLDYTDEVHGIGQTDREDLKNLINELFALYSIEEESSFQSIFES